MRKIWLLAAGLLLSKPVFADFNSALQAYDQKNYPLALQEFKVLAEIGQPLAQFNLGTMYLDGLGTKQDLVKAHAWIKLSDYGANKQQQLLAEIGQHLTAKTKQQATEFYKVIEKNYNSQTLSEALLPSFKVTKLERASIKPIKTKVPVYPQEALIKGIEGYIEVSFGLTEEGKVTDIQVIDSYPGRTFIKEGIRAIKQWTFELPENLSDEPYHYKLSFKLNNGLSKGLKRELAKLKEEAVAGDPIAQYLYGKYYRKFALDNGDNATEWYYKSAMQGIADAQHEVALSLIKGQGCVSDKEKGIKWLTKAASANLGRSQFKLAKMYQQLESEDAQSKSDFWLAKAVQAKDKTIALELARYLANRENSKARDVLEVLELVDQDSTYSKVQLYQLYAATYAKLNNFALAVEYQDKANKAIRKVSAIPDKMKMKLKQYKTLQKETI